MRIKNEEYVPLAKDLFTSFSRDLADFTNEDHNYTAAYKDAFAAKIAEVEQKEASNAILVQQKQVTKDLYLLGDNLKRPLKSIKIRIERANIPTKLPSEIQKEIYKRNFEGVADKLLSLTAIVNNNSTILKDKGMKSNVPADLQQAQTAIAAKADEQTQLIKQVASTASTSNHLYDELYQYISDICEDGKVIYEGEQKVSEYTITKMVKKLHNTGKHGEVATEQTNK